MLFRSEELLAEVNNAVAQFKASEDYVNLQVKWGLTAAEEEAPVEAKDSESAPEESSEAAA